MIKITLQGIDYNYAHVWLRTAFDEIPIFMALSLHPSISQSVDRLSDIPKQLLVTAQSGRMLAQMLVDAGIEPVVLDCFADLDTRQLSLATVKVPSLKLDDIKLAIKDLKQKYGLTHVVYGSGFENNPESLAFLEQDWIMLGNRSSVFRQFQDKKAFFRQLADLAIPCPEVVFSPPDDGREWLIKPMRGEGGVAIRRFNPADKNQDQGDCYWQRRLYGQPYSALFVAGRGWVRVLGFNRQWTASFEGHPFVFAGVGNHAQFPEADQNRVAEWLSKLVSVYPLRGLGSLDFILAEDGCYLLEINARIPASAQLYGKSVFIRHLQGCLGVLNDANREQAGPAAYQIVYAPKTLTIPDAIDWPTWAVDRPESGAIIGKGQPICSIIAAGKSPRQVSEQLSRRLQIIENILNTGL